MSLVAVPAARRPTRKMIVAVRMNSVSRIGLPRLPRQRQDEERPADRHEEEREQGGCEGADPGSPNRDRPAASRPLPPHRVWAAEIVQDETYAVVDAPKHEVERRSVPVPAECE